MYKIIVKYKNKGASKLNNFDIIKSIQNIVQFQLYWLKVKCNYIFISDFYNEFQKIFHLLRWWQILNYNNAIELGKTQWMMYVYKYIKHMQWFYLLLLFLLQINVCLKQQYTPEAMSGSNIDGLGNVYCR